MNLNSLIYLGFSASLCFLSPTLSHAGKLNDTGVTLCQDNGADEFDCPVKGFARQDAQVGRDALAAKGKLTKVGGGHAGFDFTKLDSQGKPLPADALAWDCVRDNHTHLTWENKTDDGGLRDRDNTYSWYNSNAQTNGGDKGLENGGVCAGSACDTQAYAKAVNASALCGLTNWRLPDLEELRSLQDLSGPSQCFLCPTIDTDYFTNTRDDVVWTATPYVDPNQAWVLQFHANYDLPWDKGGGIPGPSPLGQQRPLTGNIDP